MGKFQTAKMLIFPIVALSFLLTFGTMIARDWPLAVAVLAVSVGSLLLVAALEIFVPLNPHWQWWRDRQTFNDLVHGALLSIVGPRIGEFIFAGLLVMAATDAERGLWPTTLPISIQVLLAILLADFVDWAKHWVYHNSALFWPVHALHHNPRQLHVTKAGRLHFLESTVRFAVISLPLLLLGAPPIVLAWYGAIMTILGNLNHSNVDMPLPHFVHFLMATPENHRLHHAMNEDLGRSNLSPGTMLPDLLFGTFRHPSSHKSLQVGIEINPIPQSLFAQLASPFLWHFWIGRHNR